MDKKDFRAQLEAKLGVALAEFAKDASDKKFKKHIKKASKILAEGLSAPVEKVEAKPVEKAEAKPVKQTKTKKVAEPKVAKVTKVAKAVKKAAVKTAKKAAASVKKSSKPVETTEK